MQSIDINKKIEANNRIQEELHQSLACQNCVCSNCAKNRLYDMSDYGVCAGCIRCKEIGSKKAYKECPMGQYEDL